MPYIEMLELCPDWGVGFNPLYGRHPRDVKFQIFKNSVMFLDPKIVQKSSFRFVLRFNLLNKSQNLAFLSRNYYNLRGKSV
jgi:hypothetical protein